MNLEKFVIFYNAKIIEAIRKIDENKKRFLVVVNDNFKAIGTLTDGDIRRLLLKGKTLDNKIDFSKDFEKICFTDDINTLIEKFKSPKIDFLPIVDTKGKLVNIITKKQFHILLLEDIKFDLTFDFSQLKESKLEQEIYNRPWGYYKSTLLTPYAQSKIVVIFPNEELSLQEHKRREEHWVVIKGEGQAILGESELKVYPGKYIYIPKGCKHKIKNTLEDKNLIISEVQLGEYFGEDDIIRYSDKYGRLKSEEKRK